MPDAILGNYSDFKLVKTRSCVQVIIEVPIERAHEVTDLLGLPLPGAEIAVAIARIDLSKVEPAQIETDKPPAKLSQIAGITCNEGGFWRFIEERTGHEIADAESAAKFVRLACAVKSRSDLDVDARAARLWRNLKAEYDFWLRDEAA